MVTGVGLVCALGIGTDQVWQKLLAGAERRRPHHPFRRRRIRLPHRRRSPRFRSARLDRQKRTEEDGPLHPARHGRRGFRHAHGGSARSRPAIADATGVYIASGIGGFDIIEREHTKLLEGGPGRISPFFIPAAIINLASGVVSIRYGARGPNSATATACSASAHAVGDSFRLIERGDAEVMICGGTEAAITPMGIGGFAAMRALSTRNDEPARASRPFDAERDGFVVGEGAGILILESLEHAQTRGAPILAEIVGYGMSGDAYHITQPAEDGDGAYRVMRAALARRRRRARAGRLRQRARHLDAARRRHRNHRPQARLRRPRQEAAPSAPPSP